jgi:hypothetical protein
MRVSKVPLDDRKQESGGINHRLGRRKDVFQHYRGGVAIAERSTWTCGCAMEIDGGGGDLNVTITWARCGGRRRRQIMIRFQHPNKPESLRGRSSLKSARLLRRSNVAA